MSIIKAVSTNGSNKLVVPYAGKMFRSNISSDNKALCFVINKGYIETSDLTSMLTIIDDCENIKTIILVGTIEKIRLKRTKAIVYRQRVFFKSLKVMLNLCKLFGLRFELGNNFHITINNILNCVDDLKYLERYAIKFDEPIDVWLTNCCIINLNEILKNVGICSYLNDRVNLILRKKSGYLDRAPFLISSYSIDDKSSAIFLQYNYSDRRLFSYESTSDSFISDFGYTEKNIKKDIESGVFR